MKRGAIGVVVLLLLVLAVVSWLWQSEPSGGPDSSEKTSELPKVRVSVNSWAGFAPVFLAQEEGFFTAEGLDVEIVRLESATDRRAGILAGRLEILGASLDDMAVTVDQGVDALAFACADASEGGDGILVADGIEDLADLAKAEVAVQVGLPSHFFLLYVLDRAGFSAGELSLVPMSPDDAGVAFITGQVDAAVTWEPHLSAGLEARSGSKILVSTRDYPEAIIDLFIADREWVFGHPGLVEGFRNAWDRAVEELRSDEGKGLSKIEDDLGIPAADLAAILADIRIFRQDECEEVLSGRLSLAVAAVERLWQEAGYVRGPLDLEQRLELGWEDQPGQ